MEIMNTYQIMKWGQAELRNKFIHFNCLNKNEKHMLSCKVKIFEEKKKGPKEGNNQVKSKKNTIFLIMSAYDVSGSLIYIF